MELTLDSLTGDFISDFIKMMKVLNPNKEIMEKLAADGIPSEITDKLYTCFPPSNLKLFFDVDTFERKIDFLRETFVELLIYDREGDDAAKILLGTTLDGLIGYMRYVTNDKEKTIILDQIENGLNVVRKYETFADEFGTRPSPK